MTNDIGSIRLYKTLCRVLDALRSEAPKSNNVYWPPNGNSDALVQARSRALLHLFLKARFGQLSFADREAAITDGPNDGGIDAYHIDQRKKVRYVIQSKFRATAGNFKSSNVTAEDLLRMDVGRILSGKKKSEAGVAYNDKITKGLQKSLQQISDIGSYETSVVVLGNSAHLTPAQVKKLVTGYEVDQYPYDRCYRDLLFPVVNGSFFSDPNLSIDINLGNLRSGTTHLSYDARIGSAHANIKLLFVPTREMGRLMSKYKNSLLTFNPRSFLELQSNKVNQSIESSIREASKNEFALFNNGITIVSQQTSFSTDTGKQGAAQVVILRPHLINGAQTAFTLSRIYDECERKQNFSVFTGKEVLLKVITLVDSVKKHEEWLGLIGEISKASNSQTKVDEADRRSNDELQLSLQTEFFSRFGLFYERKRGEFADGLKNGYIASADVVNRERLVRMALASDLRLREARSSIRRFFEEDALSQLMKVKSVPRYVFAYESFGLLEARRKSKPKIKKDKYHVHSFGQALRYGVYAVAGVAVKRGFEKNKSAEQSVNSILNQWPEFEKWAAKQSHNSDYKDENGSFDFVNYYKGATINEDAAKYKFVV